MCHLSRFSPRGKTMCRSLGNFFKAMGQRFISLERSARAAQPFITRIVSALGDNRSIQFLPVEELCVSILGDVIDAVHDAECGNVGGAVTLATDTVGNVRRLISILQAHPEAPPTAPSPCSN